MDQNTVNFVALGIGAFSALCAAVATVATIYTVKLSRDSLLIMKEQKDADKPDLDIRVSPTRDGSKQMAQITAVNKSRRPVHIECWFWSIPGKGGITGQVLTKYNPMLRNLPVILGEQERLDVLVSLEDIDWRKLDGIGLVDVGHRWWPAKDLKEFIETAKQHSPHQPAAEKPSLEAGTTMSWEAIT